MGGAFSVPAYAMKGLYQEMQKEKGNAVTNYIIAARVSQGYEEASTISPDERADIVSRWKCIRLNVKKKKNPGEESYEALHNIMSERRKKKRARFGRSKRDEFAAIASSNVDHRSQSTTSLVPEAPIETASREPGAPLSHPLQHANTYPQPLPPHSQLDSQLGQTAVEEKAQLRQMEDAIAGSVTETSRGDAREDELISRAIRASMIELQREPEPGEDEEEMLRRAMNASLEEAQRAGVSEEEQKMLEETLQQSLLVNSSHRRHQGDHGSDSEWDSSDYEDDDDYQRIIAESKELAHLQQTSSRAEYYNTVSGATDFVDAGGEEEALRKAIEESKAAGASQTEAEEEAIRKAIEESEKVAATPQPAHGEEEDEEEAIRKVIEESERAEKERMAALEKQKTEEDIVMEYVKKQSLAEEQHRRRWEVGRDTHGESSGAGGGGSGTGAGGSSSTM
jgi:hypothetical protein